MERLTPHPVDGWMLLITLAVVILLIVGRRAM